MRWYIILTITISSITYAASYTCTGDYEKKVSFELKIEKGEVVLSTPNATFRAKLDTSYRPTVKYKGYSRFKKVTSQFKACNAMLEGMLGKGNTFDSIKVSKDLMDGAKVGHATFIYDFGDYHGQLANEKITCK